MSSVIEKGGSGFEGIKLLLCENPLPPLDEAITAAQQELHQGNFYTEAYSEPLRGLISERLDVPSRLIHVNAGSELILRQLFERLGAQVHLLTPTYALFPEIARRYTETKLLPERDFSLDLDALSVPRGTTLTVIVNPNNPNGGTFDMSPLPVLLEKHRDTYFLVDEAFIGMGGQSVVGLVPRHTNLIVTRTFSKAHSLAGFRVGYVVLPARLADELNASNDAYPLARPSLAAAVATLEHEHLIRERAITLRRWADDLAAELRKLGARTYPSETYFFLADFSPLEAWRIADELRGRGILVKALNDPRRCRPMPDLRLGLGSMRVTTSTPEGNARFVAALRTILERMTIGSHETLQVDRPPGAG